MIEVHVGKPVHGENFFGRDKEVKEIAYKLETGSSIILSAPRRFGKTSVMFEVEDTLKKSGILNIHIDLMRMYNQREFAEEIISKTYSAFGFDGSIARIKAGTSEVIQGFLNQAQKINIGIGSVGIDLATKLLKDTEKQSDEELLSFALALPGTLASKTKKHFVFAIDELGEINNFQSSNGELIKKMRSVFQTNEYVTYLFAGSQTALMNDLFQSEQSAFYRFGDVYELKPIKKAAYEKHFEQLFKKIGITDIDIPNYTNKVHQLSNGIPYYAMAITKEVMVSAKIYGNDVVSDYSVNKAFIKVYNRERAFFDQQLNVFKGKRYQAALVAAIATGENPYSIASAAGIASSNTRLELTKIVQTGMLTYRPAEDTKYIVTDPLLARYIRNNMSVAQQIREKQRIGETRGSAIDWIREQAREKIVETPSSTENQSTNVRRNR